VDNLCEPGAVEDLSDDAVALGDLATNDSTGSVRLVNKRKRPVVNYDVSEMYGKEPRYDVLGFAGYEVRDRPMDGGASGGETNSSRLQKSRQAKAWYVTSSILGYLQELTPAILSGCFINSFLKPLCFI